MSLTWTVPVPALVGSPTVTARTLSVEAVSPAPTYKRPPRVMNDERLVPVDRKL